MEAFLPDLASHVGAWLSGQGAESDVVISTRVRLARNVRGFPFPAKLDEERAAELVGKLEEEIRACPQLQGARFVGLKRTTEICREALLERFLISRELVASRAERAVAFDDEETMSLMIHEEDHLRLQSLRAGFDLDTAFERIVDVDRALEARLPFAFSEEFGYLTSCPTNVGTGMRISVMLHLPGLSLVNRELKKVLNVANRLHLAVRGLHGEGTQAHGGFYQVSNQVTLGRTERELLEDLRAVVPRIVDFERQVRRTLFQAKNEELVTRVLATQESLRTGRPIHLDAAVNGLSTLLLASAANGLPGEVASTIPKRGDLLRWLVQIHPGHLQARLRKRLGQNEVEKERGSFLQQSVSGAAA